MSFPWRVFGGKKGFLGLDIGSYALKMAEAHQKGASLVVTSFGQVRLPPDTVVEGTIKDPEKFWEAFNRLWQNLKPRSKQLNLGLYAYTTFYDRIPLGFVEAEDFEQAVLSEIESFVPFDIEDIYIDYVPILKEENKYEIVFATAKKEQVDALLELFSASPFKINAIDVDVFAVANLFEYLYGPRARMIIDIGFSKTLVIFTDKFGPLFSREFNYGLGYVTRNIAQELDIPLEEAERLQFSPPEDERGYAIREIYTEFLRNLVEEIENSHNIFKGKYYFAPDEGFVIGGGSNIPGIKEFLKEQLKMDIQEPELNTKIRFAKNFDPEYQRLVGLTGFTAVAQAIREFIA